jgi:hypothetical protein
MFGKHWQSARATVVASRIASTSGDGLVSVSEFVVDVRTPEGEMFRAKLEEPRIAIDFKAPAVGDDIAIEYDPKSHDVRFDKDDPSISWKQYRKSRQDAFEETLTRPPGSPATAAFPGSGTTTRQLPPNIQQLVQAAAAEGAVIRLDSTDPAVAELKRQLLANFGEPGGVSVPPEPEPPATPEPF